MDEEKNHDGINFEKEMLQMKKILGIALLLFLAGSLIFFLNVGMGIFEPKPPEEDVVATYNGKIIFIDDFNTFIKMEQLRTKEHLMCEVHGYEHELCEPTEPCEQHPLDSLEEYRDAVRLMVTEQIILDWATEKGITARDDVQHGLKDLLENSSMLEKMTQLHDEQLTLESISKWEVQQYYDANKELYGDKSLAEAEQEIRLILLQTKEAEFFPEYINQLKVSAGLEFNAEILQVRAPSKQDIQNYYQANIQLYEKYEMANVAEIKMSDKSTAKEAITKLNSGETFEQVAAEYSTSKAVINLDIEKNNSGLLIETIAFQLSDEEISDVIELEDGSFSIIKLNKIIPGGSYSLEEVQEQIRELLTKQVVDQEYTLRKDEALFSVHGRRYTLGDFYREYQELSPSYQKTYSTYEKKKELVEQFIVKELLLEEVGDSSYDSKEQHSIEELKIQYFSQVMHQEEVDEKLEEISQDELEKYYKDNVDEFRIPARIKLSLIWIMETEDGTGMSKAQEALALLRDGIDFATVAKQYSEDGSSADGGEFDEWLYQGYLVSELDVEAFRLEPEEVSKIIEIDGGFYIVKVREKELARVMPLEEAKEDVEAHVKQIKHEELELEMESEILEMADLTIYNRTLRYLLNKKEENK